MSRAPDRFKRFRVHVPAFRDGRYARFLTSLTLEKVMPSARSRV